MTVQEYLASQSLWELWNHHPWSGLVNTLAVIAGIAAVLWSAKHGK